MGLSPGKLRHVITFQKRHKGQDSFGAMIDKWDDVLVNTPAAVVPISGRDFIASSQTQYPVTHRITVRYHPKIIAPMRILFRNKIYSINAILPDNESGLVYLTILATEGMED